ncbi:MAG: hypothetical protein ACLPYS_15915 [Vulcanimicrobiaceae bacterium]
MAVALVTLAACTSGQVGTLPASTSPTSSTTLQLGVGTATLVDSSGAQHLGLNVVETFRGSNGDSATTSNTPTLSGPSGAFGNINTGAVSQLTGITLTQEEQLAQQVSQKTPGSYVLPSGELAFGLSVGAFGYGFAPDNLVDPTAASIIESANAGAVCPELSVPAQRGGSARYDILNSPQSITTSGLCQAANSPLLPALASFPFIGGPPIWPSPVGYGIPNGFQGWSSGFLVLVPCQTPSGNVTLGACAATGTPIPGTYNLGVAVYNGGATSAATATQANYVTKNAAATLSAGAVTNPLPAIAAPQVNIQQDGTALVSLNVPADPRIVETLIYITTEDCYGQLAGVAGSSSGGPLTHSYTLITKNFGQQTLQLTNLGPPDASGAPTHTFCTAGDLANLEASGSFTVGSKFALTAVAVAFDYPAFEASYPANTQRAPAIVGAGGTADLSISPYNAQQYLPGGNGVTHSGAPASLTAGDNGGLLL